MTELPLILLGELSDEGLRAKVPPHEGSLAGGAGHHRLLLAAWLADLVALQDKVYNSGKNKFGEKNNSVPTLLLGRTFS